MTTRQPLVRPHRHTAGTHRCATCRAKHAAIGQSKTARPSFRSLDPEWGEALDPETPEEVMAVHMSGLMAVAIGRLDGASPLVDTGEP